MNHLRRCPALTRWYLVETDTVLMIFDDQNTLIIEHAWPAPGTKYVGSGYIAMADQWLPQLPDDIPT